MRELARVRSLSSSAMLLIVAPATPITTAPNPLEVTAGCAVPTTRVTIGPKATMRSSPAAALPPSPPPQPTSGVAIVAAAVHPANRLCELRMSISQLRLSSRHDPVALHYRAEVLHGCTQIG